MDTKLLVDILSHTFCIIGSIVQTIVVSNNYFEYKTSTKSLSQIPLEIAAPSVSTCFDLYDLIDKKRLLEG